MVAHLGTSSVATGKRAEVLSTSVSSCSPRLVARAACEWRGSVAFRVARPRGCLKVVGHEGTLAGWTASLDDLGAHPMDTVQRIRYGSTTPPQPRLGDSRSRRCCRVGHEGDDIDSDADPRRQERAGLHHGLKGDVDALRRRDPRDPRYVIEPATSDGIDPVAITIGACRVARAVRVGALTGWCSSCHSAWPGSHRPRPQ